MAERTPNGRASYEAVNTTERDGSSPATASGLPRSDGSSSCADARVERVDIEVGDEAARHVARRRSTSIKVASMPAERIKNETSTSSHA